jgi:hypothetical protein
MKTMDVKNNHGELGWIKYIKVDVIIIHVK